MKHFLSDGCEGGTTVVVPIVVLKLFLWAYLKTKIYTSYLTSLNKLPQHIMNECRRNKMQKCLKMSANVLSRIFIEFHYIKVGGGQFSLYSIKSSKQGVVVKGI